jgi:two-component sensor histidine kinase/PAS domain-containing protein
MTTIRRSSGDAAWIPALQVLTLMGGRQHTDIDVEVAIIPALARPQAIPPTANLKVWMFSVAHRLYRIGAGRQSNPIDEKGATTPTAPSSLKGRLDSAADANLLAQAIVDTVREPLIVLDQELRVIVASRSFYLTFELTRQATEGYKICDLDAGVWNLPELKSLLEKIVPERGIMEGFEVELDFPRIGRRTMLLNARKVFYEGNGHTTLLLGLEDVTERRKTERALQQLLKQKEILLSEMSHRVANSLQIIASILLLKARNVESAETRTHLQDAHRRVMSIAKLQQHLQASAKGEKIAIGPYLSKLCETLAASMIGDNRPVSLKVVASAGTLTSSEAVSLGLIATELAINAIKHAFPDSERAGQIVVEYEVDGANWKLSVLDDGVGLPDIRPTGRIGLGTTLMKALAQQLEAQVAIESTQNNGTTVSITHATFTPRLPAAT